MIMKKNKQTIKISRYTFFVEHNNRHFLYNSLSNALTEVDEELFNCLKELKENHIGEEITLDDELVEDLIKNKYLTENDEDDFLIFKSVIQSIRSDKQRLILTIAPIMDCWNYPPPQCPYAPEVTADIYIK